MSDRCRRIIVFLGPTLPVVRAQGCLEAIYLPPAAHGSVFTAVREFDPSIIVLIDGEFQQAGAVRHKELLWAIERGITVVGAASMGALRAAELHPYMQGVGLIYRWYRRYQFAPDDAVAVLHGPADVGAPALTQALIDLRVTFRSAERSGLISHSQRGLLEATAKRLNFRDRTLEQVLRTLRPDGHVANSEDLLQILSSSFISQKERDAVAAFELVRRGAIGGAEIPAGLLVTRDLALDLENFGCGSL